MSIAKEPRQQMINLMYLVLTALLALNVSSEVLNAFKLINDGISATNETLNSRNDYLMGNFDFRLINDSLKTAPYLSDAKSTTKKVEEFHAYVEELKSRLIKESGGMVDGELKDKRNVEVTTRLMVDQDFGNQLENMINGLKKSLTDLPSLSQEDIDLLAHNFALTTSYDQNDAEKNGKKNWAAYNFDRVPVTAAITLLTKIQGDARTSESMILEKLYQKVDFNTYRFDNISAKVITPNNYVLAGRDEFNADIFFAATSKTQEVEIFVGEFREDMEVIDAAGNLKNQVSDFPLKEGFEMLDADNGVAKFSEVPSRAGTNKKQGVIKIPKPEEDGFNYFPFELTYKAAYPDVVISPEKMNVLYIGVDNPVSISVPGFSADQVKAYINNGELTGTNGRYTARMKEPGLSDIIVKVQKDNGETEQMGTMTFRVKRVPDPVVQLDKKSGGVIRHDRMRVQRCLDAVLKDFVFDLEYEVVSYKMTYKPRNRELQIEFESSQCFSQKAKRWIESASPGDIFFFEEIKVVGPDKIRRDVPGITFQIT